MGFLLGFFDKTQKPIFYLKRKLGFFHPCHIHSNCRSPSICLILKPHPWYVSMICCIDLIIVDFISFLIISAVPKCIARDIVIIMVFHWYTWYQLLWWHYHVPWAIHLADCQVNLVLLFLGFYVLFFFSNWPGLARGCLLLVWCPLLW